MDRQRAAGWLHRYVAAWKSYDRTAIEELFAPRAHYRYHPYDTPVVGPRAIADSWLSPENRDEPGTYDAAYEPVAVDGDIVVATGSSTYRVDDGERVYDNVFVMRFDDAGRCAEFTEWYVQRPRADAEE
jgi:hypothetical protein